MAVTTDPGLKLGAIAAAIVTALGGVDDVTILDYDPGVEGVQVTRGTPIIGVGDVAGNGTGLDEAGHALGHRDWNQVWTVRIYTKLDDPSSDWAVARRLMGEAINSLDTDHTLGGEVREMTIGDWSIEPTDPDDTATRMLVGELRIPVITLMSDPDT